MYDELRKYASGQEGIAIVETAGGVLSPAPSGSVQADLYRPLRLPTLLVGDHNLGGIGTTISAWESLHVRGYDVSSIALFADDHYGNYGYLKDYFRDRQVNTFGILPPPARAQSQQKDAQAMEEFYQASSEAIGVQSYVDNFLDWHDKRIQEIRSMSTEANEAIWHPFMQHSERSKDTIVAWDSAYGDHFQSYRTLSDKGPSTSSTEKSLLAPAFDGSASWWTQGLGHGNPNLALTAANAAGRYGHVMFANAIHKPALDLAQCLIQGSGNSRLAKVFYSDNGSTGMEVAVKMALRACMERYKPANRRDMDIRIVGLTNSYHGDTIGTMDCSEPSIYNEKVEWYRGRGIWLDFPTVKMRQGQWQIDAVPGSKGETLNFDSLTSVFDFENRTTQAEAYKKHIHAELSRRVQEENCSLGALILEPIILGAGGMLFCDPLFQKSLVEVARSFYTDQQSFISPSPPAQQVPQHQSSPTTSTDSWTGMPVIFDEVFTGLYRLGRFSAASFLHIDPDIIVNAKLLTGGLLPLCTTTASNAIFEAFWSEDKTDALLHGHSYTAHPMGCAVANESLRIMEKLDREGEWSGYKKDWTPSTASTAVMTGGEHCWSMWSTAFLDRTSHHARVEHVFALGSVVAICLKDASGGGYASTAATGLRDDLLAGRDEEEGVIHSRVMGNVLYLMAALTTPREMVRAVEGKILAALG